MKRTLCGTIFPVAWDKNGYLIDQNKKGKELLAHIRREVKISGTMMREDENGDLIFKVREYSLIT